MNKDNNTLKEILILNQCILNSKSSYHYLLEFSNLLLLYPNVFDVVLTKSSANCKIKGMVRYANHAINYKLIKLLIS